MKRIESTWDSNHVPDDVMPAGKSRNDMLAGMDTESVHDQSDEPSRHSAPVGTLRNHMPADIDTVSAHRCTGDTVPRTVAAELDDEQQRGSESTPKEPRALTDLSDKKPGCAILSDTCADMAVRQNVIMSDCV